MDAVDHSDYALSKIPAHARIRTIDADLDAYSPERRTYDLIVNCYYLDRRLFPYLRDALKPGGMVLFETYAEAEGEGFHVPSNPDYLLRRNELLRAFIGLEVLYYAEYDSVNLRGEKVRVASLAARREA